MTSSTSFSRKFIFLIGLLFCSGCTGSKVPALPVTQPALSGNYRIALLPVENLSGAKAPVRELRQALADKLRKGGVMILPDDLLTQFMTRHRLRYTGGIDDSTAEAFREEAQVDAVLITSLELYNAADPPKIALTARLVSAAKSAEILWMESAAMAGNDTPGLFDTGMIHDPAALADKALGRLSGQLAAYLSGQPGRSGEGGSAKKFSPKVFYRSDLGPEKKYRVAVIPFFNRSDRKNADDLMVLHFVRELRKIGNFHVIEPGVVRHELLQYRVIMEEGVSLANADAIFTALQADLLLTGKVNEYEDAKGSSGTPVVDFSTMLLDKVSRQVVEASEGHNSGDDRVRFFDFGRINTAHGVAAEMARGIAEMTGRPSGAR